ncbi:MAG: F0F1 ATP synthase subunit A [Clostridiales bacterium]|nr:F0F1 ATP synthase subunit A [Clostridiales bacterium]
MNFSNQNLWFLFTLGDTEIYITETILATWIVMAVLILFAVFVRLRLRSFKRVPTGFQNIIETLIEMMQGFVKDNLDEDMERHGGFFFGLFVFILTSNYSGMFGLRPPTSDLATTGALAMMVFVMIHGMGIARQKGKYIKSYIEPAFLFLPINIIGELAKPLSLAFRLFGNILSGVIIATMIYNMLPIVFRFLLPDVAHVYFDILVGALQAYVFTVLSMTFVMQKSTDIFS